jgi:hypothetical protein
MAIVAVVTPPPGDIATAESYGARVAGITLRLKG